MTAPADGGRAGAVERVNIAIARIRALTSPQEMLMRAPAMLCAATPLRHVVLSFIAEGQMVVQSSDLPDRDERDERAAAAVQAMGRAPIDLAPPLAEAEIMRRRAGGAIAIADAGADPRIDPRVADAMGASIGPCACIIAPLVIDRRVIGLLHAGRGGGAGPGAAPGAAPGAGPGRDVDLDVLAADRHLVEEFAHRLALALDTARLRRTLRQEHEQMRSFVDWVGARSGELADAPLRLSTLRRAQRQPPGGPRAGSVPRGGEDDAAFDGLLTRRELDVLRLLADGHSNHRIAELLVVSEATVKFHVNGIMRKLRVANRAEAVGRYLRIIGLRSR